MQMTMEESNVQNLVDRARKGERKAFDELVTRFSPRLRESVEKWSRFQLGPRIDVDDVLQETFLRAYESLARYSPADPTDENAFLRWICGVAKRALGDLLRKAARHESPKSSIEQTATGPSPSRIERRDERFERFQDAIDKLPADYRKVLILSRIEGRSAQEIGERMGRTPNAVYHLIVRALELLRQQFGDTESLHLPDRRLRREGAGDGE